MGIKLDDEILEALECKKINASDDIKRELRKIEQSIELQKKILDQNFEEIKKRTEKKNKYKFLISRDSNNLIKEVFAVME